MAKRPTTILRIETTNQKKDTIAVFVNFYNMPINPTAKLSPSVFDVTKLKQKPTRDGYGQGIVEAGKENANIVVMCADLTESTRNLEFKKQFPERFIQCGIHEQFLASAGAGLALAGKIPWISSYAMFCPGRAWEQVRTNICLNETNVKIVHVFHTE